MDGINAHTHVYIMYTWFGVAKLLNAHFPKPLLRINHKFCTDYLSKTQRRFRTCSNVFTCEYGSVNEWSVKCGSRDKKCAMKFSTQ